MGGLSAFGEAAWTAAAVRNAAVSAAAAKPIRRVVADIPVRRICEDIGRSPRERAVGGAEPEPLYGVAPIPEESDRGQRPEVLCFFSRGGLRQPLRGSTLSVKLPSGNRFDAPPRRGVRLDAAPGPR